MMEIHVISVIYELGREDYRHCPSHWTDAEYSTEKAKQ